MKTFAYIGKEHCGCIVAATVDTDDFKTETGEMVSRMISNGLIVERIELIETLTVRQCQCLKEGEDSFVKDLAA